MATVASGAGDSVERTVFVRKATGLVRGWSTRDAFIYAAFSINLITLGLYIFGYAPFIPDGSLLWAVLLAGGYLVVQAITYSQTIAVCRPSSPCRFHVRSIGAQSALNSGKTMKTTSGTIRIAAVT